MFCRLDDKASFWDGNIWSEAFETFFTLVIVVQILFFKFHLHLTTEILKPISSLKLELDILRKIISQG